ncbi:glycosyltransferase family 61 protein [Synechococcus sp. BDU 130192]|uniref:glycosyltransferase family 61 protein n=1 Tax=Synechococcus sp. BDU 130192 TaxID=2042059 RepID=UPI000C07C934|nr:glycosyltransferase family 61 protein [Synechococcus sp. BDU 130192]
MKILAVNQFLKITLQIKRYTLKFLRRYQQVKFALRFFRENEILQISSKFHSSHSIHKYSKAEIIRIEPLSQEEDKLNITKQWNYLYGEYTVEQPYYYIASNVRSFPNSFLVRAQDDSYMVWEQLGGRNAVIDEHLTELLPQKLRLLGKDQPTIEVNFGVFLNTRNPNNYFHWLFDGINRLEALDEISINTKNIKYITTFSFTRWQKSILKAFGIKENQCVELNGNVGSFKELLVLSPRRNHFRYSLDNCNWLREKVRSAHKNSEPFLKSPRYSSRFIIGRKLNEGRCILNQDEVLEKLRSYGFQMYYLDELDFLEQYELFNNAEIIISPHGAGLANILFCTKAHVIEIFSDRVLPFYFLLSKTLGLSYSCIQGNIDELSAFNKRPNIYVEINLLLDLIKNSF